METTQKIDQAKKPKVSASYLNCLQDEFNAKVYGVCTREMLVDWLTQNAPREAL